jgi:hypothetical protein
LNKASLLLLAVAVLRSATGAANISIQFAGGVFRVIGWNATAEPADGWVSVFPVYVSSGAGEVPPMLGSYAVEEHVLTFHPRYGIAAGVSCRAVFRGIQGAPIEAIFDAPPSAANPLTRVERVYPSNDILPSNTLRLYISFSAPMSRGEAFQHIHLMDADRNLPVDLPFLELEQELWDQNNQRLTVLFDPGRIKRGLIPTETIGPPVVEGKRYKLVIDREWHDARNVPLVEGFAKPFRGGPSDRVPPEPKNWRVTAPRAGTTDPLVIVFPKPMDYVLLQRMIGVSDGQRDIAGKIVIGRNETEWRFTPSKPWKSGSHLITADNALEDISGNHLDRPFDVDIFETVTKHINTNTSSIAFTVR